MARALGTSVTKISRMETGDRGLYHVPAKNREELLDLVRNGGEPNWWQLKPADLPSEWRDLMALGGDTDGSTGPAD